MNRAYQCTERQLEALDVTVSSCPNLAFSNTLDIDAHPKEKPLEHRAAAHPHARRCPPP